MPVGRGADRDLRVLPAVIAAFGRLAWDAGLSMVLVEGRGNVALVVGSWLGFVLVLRLVEVECLLLVNSEIQAECGACRATCVIWSIAHLKAVRTGNRAHRMELSVIAAEVERRTAFKDTYINSFYTIISAI